MEKKNIHVWIETALIAGIIAALIWALALNKNAKALEIDLENQYNRAFHEMVGYIDSVDSLLLKSQIATSPAELATLSGDIFRQAAEAKSCMGQLPTAEINLENTAKFLSQVGDYTYVLSQSMINGTQISQEEYENLAALSDCASKLKNTLTEIQDGIYSGALRFSDMSAQSKINSASAAEGDILSDLENIEKAFDEYPSLIYDGPFSEHIEKQEAEMLKSAEEIPRDAALKRAAKFIGIAENMLVYTGTTENTALDAYNFTADTDDGRTFISITQRGGYVLYFLTGTDVKEERYNISHAQKSAESFLKEHGYENMVSSYYQKDNGVATMNFAYSQNDTVCYSDLIKVRVALDSGKVVGIEAKGYLMNHRIRDNAVPKISEEEARAHISTGLDVSGTKLAIVPKDSLKEVLCYEFKGTFRDKNFIVYINADNGREEKIFLLIEDENGVLTI